jgi:hypothetical protein
VPSQQLPVLGQDQGMARERFQEGVGDRVFQKGLGQAAHADETRLFG